MIFFVLLMGIHASAADAQDFACGFGLDMEGATAQSSHTNHSYYRSSTPEQPIRPVLLFGKFKDAADPFSLTRLKDREGKWTESSANLLNVVSGKQQRHLGPALRLVQRYPRSRLSETPRLPQKTTGPVTTT